MGGPEKDTWNENELEERIENSFAVRLGVAILECIMGQLKIQSFCVSRLSLDL